MPDIPNTLAPLMFLVVTAIVVWLTVVPLAGATIARALTVERISDSLRAFIEIRWPRSLLHYISTCPVCMSYWTTAACSITAWWVIGGGVSPKEVATLTLLTLASIRPANIFASYGKRPN